MWMGSSSLRGRVARDEVMDRRLGRRTAALGEVAMS